MANTSSISIRIKIIKLSVPPSQLAPAPRPLAFADNTRGNADRERNARKPWRKWYSWKRWKELRLKVFTRDLFTCQFCGEIESDPAKLIGDHIEPHDGDPDLFWDEDNVQTLCQSCHSGEKQSIESREYR